MQSCIDTIVSRKFETPEPKEKKKKHAIEDGKYSYDTLLVFKTENSSGGGGAIPTKWFLADFFF